MALTPDLVSKSQLAHFVLVCPSGPLPFDALSITPCSENTCERAHLSREPELTRAVTSLICPQDGAGLWNLTVRVRLCGCAHTFYKRAKYTDSFHLRHCLVGGTRAYCKGHSGKSTVAYVGLLCLYQFCGSRGSAHVIAPHTLHVVSALNGSVRTGPKFHMQPRRSFFSQLRANCSMHVK